MFLAWSPEKFLLLYSVWLSYRCTVIIKTHLVQLDRDTGFPALHRYGNVRPSILSKRKRGRVVNPAP